tara:strand:- start:867 stop:1739 length:873 start_codon:yes stop_codon:yes gene_type:complete
MYYDEDLLLNIRLNILSKFVDKFVISEAKYLHNGKRKKLNFQINKFDKFKNKIEYIVVDKEPNNIIPISSNDNIQTADEKKILNSLKRENFQREMLSKGLANIDNEDVIMVSDIDEIPNLDNFKLNELNNEIAIFKQKMFYYKFNLYYENFIWFGSKAVKKKKFISPQWLRNIKNKNYAFWRVDTLFSKKKYNNIKFIEDGGWHFTCIKKPQDVHEKLLSYLHHQDYENSNLNIDKLKDKMTNKEILYDHSKDKKKENKWLTNKKLKNIEIDLLPEYIRNNKNNYQEWFD